MTFSDLRSVAQALQEVAQDREIDGFSNTADIMELLADVGTVQLEIEAERSRAVAAKKEAKAQ